MFHFSYEHCLCTCAFFHFKTVLGESVVLLCFWSQCWLKVATPWSITCFGIFLGLIESRNYRVNYVNLRERLKSNEPKYPHHSKDFYESESHKMSSSPKPQVINPNRKQGLKGHVYGIVFSGFTKYQPILTTSLLFSLSDVVEELRLPTASWRPYVRPAAGKSHAVCCGRHAALLRHSCDRNTGRDDHRVSHQWKDETVFEEK